MRASALLLALPAATLAAQNMHISMIGPKINISGSSAAECPGSVPDGTVCAFDGSDNWHEVNVTYAPETGKFAGSITTNLCSNDAYGYCEKCDPPGYNDFGHFATCTEQAFPAPEFEYGPSYAPLRGRVGLTVKGVNIYGPEEAGFGIGNNPAPCVDGTGLCYSGVDVPTCEYSLELMCGNSSNVQYSLLLDTCGGHALPYHYHEDNACDYDHTLEAHSPIIGFALDGYGIYGLYESWDEDAQNHTKPEDLDTCNGHTHTVPANDTYGVVEAEVYHYHVTSWAPYTLGCFGPVASQEQCKTLYNSSTASTGECGEGVHFIQTPEEPDGYCYDTDCPCFDGRQSRYGRNSDETECPNGVDDDATVGSRVVNGSVYRV